MDMVFEIRHLGKPFGRGTAERQGLYWHIRCLCPEPARLSLVTEGGNRDLGQTVPMEGGFGLDTRVSVKSLKGMPVGIVPAGGEAFYPIREGEPFFPLTGIRSGVLVFRQGEPGLLLQKESSNPTGQWSEPNTWE